MLLLGQHLYLDVNDFKDSIRWLFAKNDVNIKEFPVSPSQKKRWLLGYESWVQTKHTITKEPHPALHVSLTIGYLVRLWVNRLDHLPQKSTTFQPRLNLDVCTIIQCTGKARRPLQRSVNMKVDWQNICSK